MSKLIGLFGRDFVNLYGGPPALLISTAEPSNYRHIPYVGRE